MHKTCTNLLMPFNYHLSESIKISKIGKFKMQYHFTVSSSLILTGNDVNVVFLQPRSITLQYRSACVQWHCNNVPDVIDAGNARPLSLLHSSLSLFLTLHSPMNPSISSLETLLPRTGSVWPRPSGSGGFTDGAEIALLSQIYFEPRALSVIHQCDGLAPEVSRWTRNNASWKFSTHRGYSLALNIRC